MNLDDVSIQDMRMISELPQFDSLRSFAQSQNLTIAKASRQLKKLEESLQVQLVRRTNKGISSTSEGDSLAAKARDILRLVEGFRSVSDKRSVKPFQKTLVVGTRGFLGVCLASSIIQSIKGLNYGLKLVDMSPKETVQAAKDNYLSAVLGFEELDLGKSWKSKSIGKLEWKIYGRQGHPLSNTVGVHSQDLEDFRIGHHVFWDGKKLVTNEGMLHDVYQIRQLGYGTQTAAAALAVASTTDQVVCVPTIVAEDYLTMGKIVEIPVIDAEPIEIQLYLNIHTEMVSAKVYRRLRFQLETRLESI